MWLDTYESPLGTMLMASDEEGLTGLWFKGQKYELYGIKGPVEQRKTDIGASAKEWLDCYFSGEQVNVFSPLHLMGTLFQMDVWHILLSIPYGKTMTYGEIAKVLARQYGIPTMSAQAVGNAVGHNPISIIVPCHRVLGKSGELTGYAGGLDRKRALLALEHVIV